MGPEQSDAVFSVYAQIWRRAESEGAWVSYYGATIRGESGYFHPREQEGRKPAIWILRPYYQSDEKPSRKRNEQLGTTAAE